MVGRDAYMVDVGDGAAEQLAKAGVGIGRVKAVFLSHLHFDHIGGLFGLLGLRQQIGVAGTLTIYGPPGTKILVDGLCAAMEPSVQAGYGLPGEKFASPAAQLRVVELGDGSTATEGTVHILARQNSHYSFATGSADDKRFKSLSYRFEVAGRVIVYTGDTGPSKAVDQLATGADLLRPVDN